jgi:hypothetical protein
MPKVMSDFHVRNQGQRRSLLAGRAALDLARVEHYIILERLRPLFIRDVHHAELQYARSVTTTSWQLVLLPTA